MTFGKIGARNMMWHRPYLQFDFRQVIVIPALSSRNKIEVFLSFDSAMLDGVRRICLGAGGSTRQYYAVGANKTFPADWTTNPPLISAGQIYCFGIEGSTQNNASVLMDGVVLASDFVYGASRYLALGSHSSNTTSKNFSGRIFEVDGFDRNGAMVNKYIPHVENGRPCLKDTIYGNIVYSESGKDDPIFGRL